MKTHCNPVRKTGFEPISGNPHGSRQRSRSYSGGPVSAVVLALFLFALTPPCAAESLSLLEGLEIVTSRGYEVRIAKAQRESADFAEVLAKSRMKPRVDAYADHTWLENRPEAIFGTDSTPLSEDHFLRYGVSVRQTITDFGRTRAGVDSAAALALAREGSFERTQNGLALEFVQAYISLLKAEKALDVANQEVRSFRAHAADAEKLYDAGEVTRSDVLAAEVALSDALQREIIARDHRELAASRVNYLTLRPLDRPLQAGDFPSPFSGQPDLDLLLSEAEGSRPELRIIDEQITARRAQLRLQEKDSYPVIFVSGGYSFEENPYRVHEDNWSAVIGMTWDIYTGGARTASQAQATLALSADLTERERIKERIRFEVREAVLQYNGAAERIIVAEKTVDQAMENLRLQEVMYREGEASATEVTEAVTTLTKARNNLWGALYDRQRAETQLLYASGADLLSAYLAVGITEQGTFPENEIRENNNE